MNLFSSSLCRRGAFECVCCRSEIKIFWASTADYESPLSGVSDFEEREELIRQYQSYIFNYQLALPICVCLCEVLFMGGRSSARNLVQTHV
jgi:hypothetical protein